jgi:ankyrin repeat protein
MSSTSEIRPSIENAKKEFLDSCKEGNLQRLKSSLENLGFSIGENDEFSEEVMKIVFEEKNLEIARFLIDQGIKFDLQKKLNLASKSGKNKFVSFLIKLGADVNSLNEDSTALQEACKSGHLETVKLLLQHGADVNKANSHDKAPLIFANDFEIIETLLDNGANINSIDIWNCSVLTEALNKGNISLAKYLIKRGAHYKLEQFKSYAEKRQLINVRSVEGISFLIENGVNFDFELEYEQSPMFDAIFKEDIKIVKLLLKNGVPINRQSKSGVSLLMKACSWHSLEIVEYLIQNGADVMARDDDNKSVMEYASLSNKCSKCLIEKGIFQQESLDTRYKCIKIAVENQVVGFFEALINNGVDLTVFDKFLHNPLQLACIAGHKNIVELLINKAKVNVNHRNQVDETALTLAKSKGKTEIAELLIQHGGIE